MVRYEVEAYRLYYFKFGLIERGTILVGTKSFVF